MCHEPFVKSGPRALRTAIGSCQTYAISLPIAGELLGEFPRRSFLGGENTPRYSTEEAIAL